MTEYLTVYSIHRGLPGYPPYTLARRDVVLSPPTANDNLPLPAVVTAISGADSLEAVKANIPGNARQIGPAFSDGPLVSVWVVMALSPIELLRKRLATDLTTKERWHITDQFSAWNGVCPECGGREWSAGPRAGALNQNIVCDQCKAGLNIFVFGDILQAQRLLP